MNEARSDFHKAYWSYLFNDFFESECFVPRNLNPRPLTSFLGFAFYSLTLLVSFIQFRNRAQAFAENFLAKVKVSF